MKGLVFTEFLDFVEAQFGVDTVEATIDAAQLPSGGAYTSVGTYDHAEIVALVRELSRTTAVPPPHLVGAFGEHLFARFVTLYPQFFADVSDTFGFLERVEGYVHVEVKKLYPDAELPSFECSRLGQDKFEMLYRSTRGLGDLAEGLILGCAKHFGDAIQLKREDLTSGNGTELRFELVRSR